MANKMIMTITISLEGRAALEERAETAKKSMSQFIEDLILKGYEEKPPIFQIEGGVNVQYQDNTPNQSAPETHPE